MPVRRSITRGTRDVHAWCAASLVQATQGPSNPRGSLEGCQRNHDVVIISSILYIPFSLPPLSTSTYSKSTPNSLYPYTLEPRPARSMPYTQPLFPPMDTPVGLFLPRSSEQETPWRPPPVFNSTRVAHVINLPHNILRPLE